MAGAEIYRRRIPVIEKTGYPLGRNIHHDPRSLAYQVRADGTVKTVRWDRIIPVLDQGNLGSCTGNAAVGHLGTQPVDATLASLLTSGLVLDEQEAIAIYSDAEKIDGGHGYPPEDEGSSGLSVAKAAKARALISGYTHMTSLAACQTAIQTGPFIIGINWYGDFDYPDANGLVAIGGSLRGGHEVEVIGYDAATGLWEAVNSWGISYGVGGHFFFTSGTFSRLLSEDGDATQFVPLSQPAPVPQPVPPPAPAPTPGPPYFPGPTPTPPGPVPAPVPVPGPTALDRALWLDVKAWTKTRRYGANHDAQQAIIQWATAYGFDTGEHTPEHEA